jgi:hypothetical protein
VDREEFLDAYRTLWDVSTSEGVTLYGDRYKSLMYLAMVHNDAGANQICDEFHAGSGFLNNHVLLGSYLEQSLRLVNPRVSLHYMEYTKYFTSDDFSNHINNQMDGGNWTTILSDKWFGSNDPESGIILDSRWAKSEIPYVDADFLEREMLPVTTTFFPDEEERWLEKTGPHIMSPYGLLRAPWNYNPSPYTTRYNNINRLQFTEIDQGVVKPYLGSTCTDMQGFFEENVVGKSLQSYLEYDEDSVHGYIHFTFGGAGGDRASDIDTELSETYGLSPTHLMYIAEANQRFVKTYLTGKTDEELGFLNPLTCSSDFDTDSLPGEDDGPLCECNSYYFESEENLDTLIGLYFMWFMPDNDSIFGDDFDTNKAVMQLACSRMSYDGDMAGSGAATDPLFWVAHGAVERLFQRTVFDQVLADKDFVSSPRGKGCSGHADEGKKYWLKGLYFVDETVDPTALTNVELAGILDPTSDNYRDYIDFVYEDSDWAWCDGFDSWLET